MKVAIPVLLIYCYFHFYKDPQIREDHLKSAYDAVDKYNALRSEGGSRVDKCTYAEVAAHELRKDGVNEHADLFDGRVKTEYAMAGFGR